MMQEAREARIAAGGSGKMTFGEWFANVFRPHFMWPTIIGVVVIAALIFTLADFVGRVEPDFTLTVATVGLFREEDAAELKALIEDTVGDANGDGKTEVALNIYMIPVDTAQDSDEVQLGAGATGVNALSSSQEGQSTGEQMMQACDISFFSDEDNVLYLLDDSIAARFGRDYYEYLADYGFASDSPVKYPAKGLPVMDRLLAENSPECGFYFKGWNESKKNNKTFIRNYELAEDVLRAIIDAD